MHPAGNAKLKLGVLCLWMTLPAATDSSVKFLASSSAVTRTTTIAGIQAQYLQKRPQFNSFYCSGCPKTLVRLACINNGTPDTPMTKYRISAVPSITLDARGTATISTHFMLANILVLPCFPPPTPPVITPQLGGSQTT